jgi:uncharacterized surface protein with fasciclin (FAS1) repeats
MSTDKTKQAFQHAIDSTQQTIYQRTVHYRNLVIFTSLSILIFLLWALIQFSWHPLLGLFVLVPFYGIFVYLDNRMVSKWQEQLLISWQEGKLDLKIFISVINGFSHLPKNTLQAMLNLLPSNTIPDTDKQPSVTRQALVYTLITINRHQNQQILFSTLVSTTALICIFVAMLQWHWFPLTGLLVIPCLLAIKTGISNFTFKHWKNQITALQANDLAVENFILLAQQLDWQAVPTWRKEKLLELEYLIEKE